MKLATILAASVAADERFFSHDTYPSQQNLDMVDSWWYSGPNVPANQMNKMRSTVPKFFGAYFPDQAAARFSEKWEKLEDDMESAAADCTFALKGANGRNRRSTGTEERFMNAFVQGGFAPNDVKTDFYAVADGHARWIVKQVQESCPDKAQRLLRRVDRLRHVMAWRYCKNYKGLPVLTPETQDQDPVGFCWWSYYKWNGEVKGHPRKSMKAILEGGKYSINGEQ